MHSGKKWGNWEAPCWEMLVFGGKFCLFVHKNIKTVFKFGGLRSRKITFFQAVGIVMHRGAQTAY